MSRLRLALGRAAAGLARWAGVASPRAYEAGRVRRTDPDFTPVLIGPNALADQTLDLVRRRCRWLGDNHPLIAGAKTTLIHNVCGEDGIMLRPATEWPELNKALKALWFELEEGVDPGRECSLRESQAVFLGELFDGGDVLAHYPVVEAFRGAPAGPALELIAAEQLDLMHTRSGRPGEPRIRQGVELDRAGRRVAYHVLTEHPGDFWAGAGGLARTRRVPASEARLCLVMRRPGQIRGVPMIVAAVQTSRLEDGYQDAFLQMALAAACIGVFFEGLPATAEVIKSLQRSGLIDADGNPVRRLEPGLIGYMQPGMKPTVLSPNLPPPNFEQVSALLARRMGASAGMGYADFTRDEGDTTFSAARAEALKSRKLYRAAQVYVYRHHTAPLYRRMVAWAIAAGRVALTDAQQTAWLRTPTALTRCAPILPGWEWVNPQQEAQAAEISLRIGVRSLPELVAEHGRHFEDVIDEQLEAEIYERERRQALGLPPRPTAAPGTPGAPGAPGQGNGQGGDRGGDDEDEPRGRPGGRLTGLNGHPHHLNGVLSC